MKQDITDVRRLGGNKPNKFPFVVTTTMWQGAGTKKERERESILKENQEYFGQMGVKFIRHPDMKTPQDSAQDIIRILLKNNQTINLATSIGPNKGGHSREHGQFSSHKIHRLIRRLFG
jgi:hypothetical protein